jgi:phage antirepressor YoqD-like protein
MSTPKVKPLKDVSVKEAATLLGVCPNKLFAFLREQKVFSQDNIPYGRYTARGLFRLKLVGVRDLESNRYLRTHGQPRVTADGLVFIRDLLNEHPETAQAIRRRNRPARDPKTARRSAESRARRIAGAG